MRKFKVKNRPKRKYTRKNITSSPSSLERSWLVGLLPLFILAIALFTTLIIGLNLREQDLAVDFSFQAPQFSTKPIEQVFTDLPKLLVQPTVFISTLWSAIAAFFVGLADFVVQTAVNFGILLQRVVIQLGAMLDPRPMFGIIGSGTVSAWNGLTSFMIAAVGAIGFGISFVIQSLIAFFVVVGQAIGFVIQALWGGFLIATNVILTTFVMIGNAITAFVVMIANVLGATAIFIVIKITAFVEALLYLLGTPFRMLGAFWVLIKPYVDVFVSHLQMAGSDLSHGFHALNNFSSIIGPSK